MIMRQRSFPMHYLCVKIHVLYPPKYIQLFKKWNNSGKVNDANIRKY